MTLFTIGVVFAIRILLEVVGAFAILLAGWVLLGSWISCWLDERRDRQAQP